MPRGLLKASKGHRFHLLLFNYACMWLAYFTAAPLLASDSPTIIKNEYIVVLKEELSDQESEWMYRTSSN